MLDFDNIDRYITDQPGMGIMWRRDEHRRYNTVRIGIGCDPAKYMPNKTIALSLTTVNQGYIVEINANATHSPGNHLRADVYRFELPGNDAEIERDKRVEMEDKTAIGCSLWPFNTAYLQTVPKISIAIRDESSLRSLLEGLGGTV